MAGQDKEIRNENGYADPLFLANSYNANVPLGNITFNGENFLNWSRSIKLALGSKNRLGFLEGKVTKPKPDDPKSMDEKIANSFTYIDSVEKLWNELKERYGETNAHVLYFLKKQVKNLEQEKVHCELLKKFMEIQERNKVIDFVMGLSKKNVNIVGNIMAMEPLPSLNKAFHLVQQAEKQRQILEGHNTTKASAFVVNKMNQGRGNGSFQIRETKEMKMKNWCDHCKMKGHTIDDFFKIHGYLDRFKNNPKGKGGMKYVANVEKEENEYLEEEPLDYGSKGGITEGKIDSKLVSAIVQEDPYCKENVASGVKENGLYRLEVKCGQVNEAREE
uniref:Retrotransposon Copia-like N-terminal domain-containing protein n=1 Tax=Chenopodium quinoa TaxID=63459 RepID=A0A803MT63_CHEQI